VAIERRDPLTGAARTDWFLRGTEPPPQASAAGAGGAPEDSPLAARISYPAREMLIALDPDIPEGSQRVPFEARPASARLRWRLDGRDLGPAGETLFWDPAPGRHRLALVGPGDQVLDSAPFAVIRSANSRGGSHAGPVAGP
jgi:penicillin-binding protein 1C